MDGKSVNKRLQQHPSDGIVSGRVSPCFLMYMGKNCSDEVPAVASGYYQSLGEHAGVVLRDRHIHAEARRPYPSTRPYEAVQIPGEVRFLVAAAQITLGSRGFDLFVIVVVV